eukprot:2582281-Heterocapsa_arctica.AAC.1
MTCRDIQIAAPCAWVMICTTHHLRHVRAEAAKIVVRNAYAYTCMTCRDIQIAAPCAWVNWAGCRAPVSGRGRTSAPK